MKNKVRLIEGFSLLTKQQIFDISAKHVLANGKPSVVLSDAGKYNGCVYTGIGCAAAPFILPEDREVARGSWYTVSNDADNKHEHLLIQEMQNCHDNASIAGERGEDCLSLNFIEEYKKRMLVVASANGLNTSVLNKS
jgi:hypothetical protein